MQLFKTNITNHNIVIIIKESKFVFFSYTINKDKLQNTRYFSIYAFIFLDRFRVRRSIYYYYAYTKLFIAMIVIYMTGQL